MIVLIGGEKGGSGKTTLAINLAAMRTRKADNILLIDTDMQQTASYWCSLREDKGISPRVASIQKFDKAVKTEVLQLKTKYDDIIIDAGGRDSPELRGALLVSQKAIIPLRPSQFDLWTLGRMNSLIESAKDFNPTLEAFVIINQASTNPCVKETEVAKDIIKEFSFIKLLQTVVCERIAYRRAAIEGLSVIEHKPVDVKAVEEMGSFYKEIFNERL